MTHRLITVGFVAWMALAAAGGKTVADENARSQLASSNGAGVQRTITTAGSFDGDNPFFQSLGTNGRTCFTCHQPDQGWTVTPEGIRRRFEETRGLDPIFRTNDGSNCEGADVSDPARRGAAFSQLLTRGLIRIGLPVPRGAEFTIVDVDDPYGCGAPFTEVSMYRRPLPTTNLRFLSSVMWDGRETLPGHAIRADLLTQAVDATTGHAQGAAPSAAQVTAIVDFELSLFTAQIDGRSVGSLSARQARGGPNGLPAQSFCIGINDPLDLLPVVPGACTTSSGGLDPNVFSLFGAWQPNESSGRRAIARGEQLFNTRQFTIDGVGGLNGGLGDPIAGPFTGTCTVCHNTPNAGNHSISMALNIGLTDESRRTADLPLYRLQNNTTNEQIATTDPGRAMVTGKWNDIGKFKGPVLRALASRAPYFHNGSAATLAEAIDFYDTRFHIGLSPQEKADLVAFLNAL